MANGLQVFAYVSRYKVEQLYDQLSDFSVDKKTVRRGRQGTVSADAGIGALFGFLHGSLRAGGKLNRDVEESGEVTTIQKLRRVLSHIEQHETVIDLVKAIDRKAVGLNAFCYRYKGRFVTVGTVNRSGTQFQANQRAVAKLGGELPASEQQLIEVGRAENEFPEAGPNRGALVSSMCIIASRHQAYTIQLACSYKYFSDMGRSWSESTNEWWVSPHSGNYHFFEGEGESWFDSIVFIKGVNGMTILGTPLVLVNAQGSGLNLSGAEAPVELVNGY